MDGDSVVIKHRGLPGHTTPLTELRYHLPAPLDTMERWEPPADASKAVFTRVVPLEANAAFDELREHAWKKTAGPQAWTYISEFGDPETYVGETRVVPGGVNERIVACEPGKFFDYTITAGLFPTHFHLGQVALTEFTSDAGEKLTRVTWTVNFKPWFGVWLVVRLVLCSIPMFLGNFESACVKRAQAEAEAAAAAVAKPKRKGSRA